MSYNGSGVFNINTAGQPVVTGTVISSTAFNALTADLATGLTTALTKDGQTTPTANIPMGGFKVTGIAAATTTGDALSYGRAATVSTLTNSALTSGRVPYASTAGLLTDSANLTFNGSAFAVTGTVGVSGIITSTVTSGQVLAAGSATTGGIYSNFGNTGGTLQYGVDNSTGSYIYSGSSNYAGFIGTSAATPLVLATNAVVRATIDSSGNVGIGITPTNSANYTTLEVSNATNGAIFNLCNGATNKGQVFYDSGGIGVNTLGTARNIRWKAGAISGATDAHMTLNTNGGLKTYNTIGVGNTAPSTSGAGITFPATQSASSNANTLDDYEEGTWTPSIGGTATYNAQAGTYTKIGNVVTVAFDIYILLKGTGSATTVSGLPFTTANTTPYNENGSGVAYFSAIATSVTYLTAVLNKNATTLHFDGLSAAAATMPSTINVFQNSTDVYCTITYLI